MVNPSLTDGGLGDLFGTSVLATLIIEGLKRTRWFPWINQHTGTLNRCLSFLVAVGYQAGFRFSMNGSLFAGGVAHIAFPALGQALHLLVDSGASFGVQELFYKAGIKPAVKNGPAHPSDPDPDKRKELEDLASAAELMAAKLRKELAPPEEKPADE